MIALGRTLLQDIYSSTPLISTFLPSNRAASGTALLPNTDESHSSILKPAPSAEEISRYFERITPLRFSQPHQPVASDFSPPLEGLSLTAYSAGHTLGGTIWHIQYGMESVIYAVDWNQARENVIGGAAWFGGHGGTEVIEPLRKPTALVCSSRNGDGARQSGTKRKRDAALLDHIRSSISKDGTVLIPTDSSGRVLELAYVLERAWQQAPDDPIFRNTRLYLASRSASATIKHAQSLLEWMDEAVVREFEAEEEVNTTNKNSKQTNGVSSKPSKPFEFQYVRTIDRPRQLEKALKKSGPKVILASDSSLTWGLSKSTLAEMADNATNLVVLTDALTDVEGANQLLGSSVWQILHKQEDGVTLAQSSEGDHLEQIHAGGKTVMFQDTLKVALNQSEQQTYQQYLATQRQLQTSLASGNEAGVDEAADIADDSSSSSSSNESDDEYQGRALNVSAALGHAGRAKRDLSEKDLGVSILLRKSGVYDFDVRQFKRGRNAVFPYIHHRKRGDAFGEYIKPEDFLRAEEKEEARVGDMNTSAGTVGQKRKWDDVTNGKEAQGTVKSRKTGKDTKVEDPRIRTAQPVAEVESSDESEPEPEQEVGPGKASFRNAEIQLNARLAFVDYSGIHDQRSLRNLIELINPRKLILVGGTKNETDALAVHCKALLAAKDSESTTTADVFTPTIGETIDASVDTNAWTVKLSRGLVKRLAWQNVHKMGIAALSAELKGEQLGDSLEAAAKSKKAKLSKAPPSEPLEPGKVQPLLDLVPSASADIRSGTQPLYVGDMRLADLRRLLGSLGYSAEFRGEGTLLINGIVAVKKLSSGRIVVEGSPVVAPSVIAPRSAGTFYDVRRTIYERLAVIAGG